MRIMVHDYGGYAFIVPLSRELARRGYEVVHTYCASVQTPQGAMRRTDDDPRGLSFEGLTLASKIKKQSFVQRWKLERRYSVMLARLVERVQPDVLISADTPSQIQAALAKQCQRRGIRFVSWVQDLYGVAAHGILSRRFPIVGGIIGRHFIRLDQSSLRDSPAIVVITDAYRARLGEWGVDADRVTFIPNWAPIDELPTHSKRNDWSVAHNLHECICFLYSGTLSMKHNPRLLLELALKFRDRPHVRVVLVSEGSGADWLRAAALEHGLTNVVIFPFQPYSDVSHVLASADVLVSILEPEAGKFSVPSKVLTYLCAGRPLLLAVPLDNLSARTVVEAEAGIIVSPDDVAGFTNGAERLLNDESRRQEYGRHARAHAERHFNIHQITDRFEKIIFDIAGAAGSLNNRISAISRNVVRQAN